MQHIEDAAPAYTRRDGNLPWYWTGLQGAIALAAGIYFIVAPNTANSTVRLLLAILLVVCSLSDISTGFRNHAGPPDAFPMTPFLLVRGGAGATLGLVFFFATRAGFLTDRDARYILGLGLVGYAIIGLAGVIMSLVTDQVHWMATSTSVLFLMLGAVLMYNNREAVEAGQSVRFLGRAAVTGGGILLVDTYFLKRGQEAAARSFDAPGDPAPNQMRDR